MRRIGAISTSFLFLLSVALFAQTPPTLTNITSDQPARGTAKLSGFAINIDRGPVLTFHGSDFSGSMAARFKTINLKGEKGTLDFPFDETFTGGIEDSGKVDLAFLENEHDFKSDPLHITSGPVYLVDTATGLVSADSVEVVMIPSVFAITQYRGDFFGEELMLLPGDSLFIDGSGFVQDSTILIFPKAGGDTLHVKPVAIGSSSDDPEGSVFLPDSIVNGLYAKFAVPADIAEEGNILAETPSGVSAPFLFRKAKISTITRTGPPLRGTPADPAKLSVNAGDTLEMSISGLLSGVFPEDKSVLRFPQRTTLERIPFDSLSADSSRAWVTVNVDANSGSAFIFNSYFHTLNLYDYYIVGPPSPFIQVVPTLDSLGGQFIAPGFRIDLYGGGLRNDRSFGVPVVVFTKAGGGTIRVNSVAFSLRIGKLQVDVPDSAVSGPVFVETQGGRSNSLDITIDLKPLEIIATAIRGVPADTSVPSANIGQTIEVKSEGLKSTTRLSVTRDGFANASFSVRNISADSTTAEVVINDNFLATGEAFLQDFTTGELSVAKPLQIVPTLDFASSPGYAAGNNVTLYGSGLIRLLDSTKVFFTDSTGAEREAEIVSYDSNLDKVTVKLPEHVVEGLVRVKNFGGEDSLLVEPPILQKLIVTAQSGTPGVDSLPSANIGQVMKVQGKNLNNNVEMTFPTILHTGSQSSVSLELQNTSSGTEGELTVGTASNASSLSIKSGEVYLRTRNPGSLPDLLSGQKLLLQIVPEIFSFAINAFEAGEVATIRGSGFIEGETVVYFRDSTGALIAGLNVDVIGANNELQVTLPEGAAIQPITVATGGGTSAAFHLLPPLITEITPTEGIRGAALQVTLKGLNFAENAEVSFSGTGITVDTTAFFGQELLIAALLIDPGAALGPRDIIVSNSVEMADTLFSAFTILRDSLPPAVQSVSQLPNTGITNQPYPVQAQASDNIGLQNVFLVYSTDNFATQDSLEMALNSEQAFEVGIPAQPLGTTVQYFVAAYDFDGNRTTNPPNAPAANFTFAVLSIPVFDPIADQTVDEGQLLTFTVNATDADSDPITYTAANLPRGAAFANREFSWTPDYKQSGDFVVTFTADDGNDGAAMLEVKITVNEINDPPIVRGPARKIVFAGQMLDFPVTIKDPDGDNLTVTLQNIPFGATVSNISSTTRAFRWKPTANDVGTYEPAFIANDGLVSDTLVTPIDVLQPSGPIVESLKPNFGHIGDMVTLKGIAFGDGAGTVLFNGTPSVAMVSGDTVAMAVVPVGAQSGPLTLISPDGKISASRPFTVLPPPTVNLIANELEASAPLALLGNPITLRAHIENDGSFAADAKVTFFDNHPDSGGVAFGAPVPFNIGAKDTAQVAFEWVTQTEGAFTPHIRISGANPRENNLSDNIVGDGTVRVVKGGGIEFISLHAPVGEFIIGQPVSYSVFLLNASTSAASVTSITIADAFGFVAASALLVALPPGALRKFDFTVTLPEATTPGAYSTELRVETAKGSIFTTDINFEAVEASKQITVRLIDKRGRFPVPNARVFANGAEQTPTNSSGEALFELSRGESIEIVFFKESHLPERATLSHDGRKKIVEIFIDPGEILVTNIQVEPISSEDLLNLGLDLEDAENFNFFTFSAQIQLKPDEPPTNVEWISTGGGTGEEGYLPPCLAAAEAKGGIVASGDSIIIKQEEKFCQAQLRRIRFVIYADGDSCFTSSEPFFPNRLVISPNPCDPPQTLEERKDERKITIRVGSELKTFTCNQRTLTVCRPERTDDEEGSGVSGGGGSSQGGAIQPMADVTIPYVLMVDGNIRTLKEFFNVTLALANQADPSFTVTDLNTTLITDQSGSMPLAIVKEAESLQDLVGGQSAAATWVLRGDEVGVHTFQITIQGILQPGNIRISATEFATVTVNEPPELFLELQHPAELSVGQGFVLSATVTNLSETTPAQLASVEIFLKNSSTATLASDALQELGDIPPMQSRTVSWQLQALGGGKLYACNQSSGSNLGFALQIGGTPCEDAIPADTEMDDDVPPGKVVILGTDVPFPNAQVSASGIHQEEAVRVNAVTDSDGNYIFQKRIEGDDLPFSIFINDFFGQNKVRPKNLDFRESVAPNATEMPTLQVGALNTYNAMTLIMTGLSDTEQLNPFNVLLAKQAQEELAQIDAFLKEATQNELWGEDLDQIREEYYRLFLANRLLWESRLPAEKLAVISSEGVSAALSMAISELYGWLKSKTKIDSLIYRKVTAMGGGEEKVEEYMDDFYRANAKAFQEKIAPFLISVLNYFSISIAAGQPTDDDPLNFAKIYTDLVFDTIEEFVREGVLNWSEVDKKFKTAISEFVHNSYAAKIDTFFVRALANAQNYAGPDSVGSLLFSQEQVRDAQIRIASGAKIAEETTIVANAIATFFSEYSKGSDKYIDATTVAAATPLAPVAVPVNAWLSKLKAAASNLNKVFTVAAALPAPVELFVEIPKKLEQGIDAAYDIPPTQNAPSIQPQQQVAQGNGVNSLSSGSRLLVRPLAADLMSFRNQLQIVRDHIAIDSVRLARIVYAGQFLPVDKALRSSLAQTETVLHSGAVLSFSQQAADADSLFASFADSLMQFNTNGLVLPWAFTRYSIVGEIEGGAANADFPQAKQDVLIAIDDLIRRAQNLEPLISSAMNAYTARGFTRQTALIDSVWLTVDGSPDPTIASVPATISVHARVQNLSTSSVSGLQVSLRKGSAEGLSFSSGDSVMLVPQLSPADGVPQGADEFIANWQLSYQGALLDGQGLALSVQLNSEDDTIFTGFGVTEFLSFHGVDTDGDGMPDDYEIAVSHDPNRDDAAEDADKDELANLEEYLLGTDPNDPDSDGDGIPDGIESEQGSNPFDASSPLTAGTAALTLPLRLEPTSGDTLSLPVSISTQSSVTFAQFTVDYDSTLLRFHDVKLDANLLNFTLDSVNSNPAFAPSTPGTNKNVLVQLASANSSISGTSKAIAVLRFIATASSDTTTQIAFDQNSANSLLKDQDGSNLNIVSFTDAAVKVREIVVSVEEPQQIPDEFRLSQNYPNPFNAESTIRYDIPAQVGNAVEVKIYIYNILGQRVRTLVDGKQAPGSYKVIWNGRNDRGLQVSTGVYFFTMRAGDFQTRKKMLLLK